MLVPYCSLPQARFPQVKHIQRLLSSSHPLHRAPLCCTLIASPLLVCFVCIQLCNVSCQGTSFASTAANFVCIFWISGRSISFWPHLRQLIWTSLVILSVLPLISSFVRFSCSWSGTRVWWICAMRVWLGWCLVLGYDQWSWFSWDCWDMYMRSMWRWVLNLLYVIMLTTRGMWTL